MRNRRIKANGVELYTEAFGRSSDPAILLIMGAMASGAWWPREFCERLADRGRHVIRYDHRDTGASTSYTPGEIHYSVEDLADDAIGVLDAYGIERAHAAGMSLGGILAQLIALKYPDRTLTITLISSERLGPKDPEIAPIDPKIIAYHARAYEVDRSDREAVLDYMVGGWRLLSGSAREFDEAAIRAIAVEDLNRTPNPLASMNHALLTGDERWYGRLDEIRAPALVIHGTDDPVLPYAAGVKLAASLPKSTLLTLEGTGHELHRDDWDGIIGALAAHTAA